MISDPVTLIYKGHGRHYYTHSRSDIYGRTGILGCTGYLHRTCTIDTSSTLANQNSSFSSHLSGSPSSDPPISLGRYSVFAGIRRQDVVLNSMFAGSVALVNSREFLIGMEDVFGSRKRVRGTLIDWVPRNPGVQKFPTLSVENRRRTRKVSVPPVIFAEIHGCCAQLADRLC